MTYSEFEQIPDGRKRVYLSDLYAKLLEGTISQHELIFVAGIIRQLATNPLIKIDLRIVNENFFIDLNLFESDANFIRLT